ncbi:MAG TPA: hypothetical protein VGA75_09115 [Paracoccaceae bacterium]
MTRAAPALPAFIAVIALTACAPQTPAPAVAPAVATVAFAGEDYPVRQSARGWQVMVDGRPVPCLRPTERDCYWSLRNHLRVQAALDEMGL